MEHLSLIKAIGLLFIFFSLLCFFIEPFYPFTGFSISEQLFNNPNYPLYILSLVLFLTGVFLLFVREKE